MISIFSFLDIFLWLDAIRILCLLVHYFILVCIVHLDIVVISVWSGMIQTFCLQYFHLCLHYSVFDLFIKLCAPFIDALLHLCSLGFVCLFVWVRFVPLHYSSLLELCHLCFVGFAWLIGLDSNIVPLRWIVNSSLLPWLLVDWLDWHAFCLFD